MIVEARKALADFSGDADKALSTGGLAAEDLIKWADFSGDADKALSTVHNVGGMLRDHSADFSGDADKALSTLR